MKKKALLLSSVLFLLSFLSLPSAQHVHAGECRYFTANGVNNWYPFSYRTETGELSGVIVDGMHEALKRIGLHLIIQTDRPWKRIMFDLENNQLDMVLGAYWNKERAKKFHYSAIMGTDELRIFVKKGKEFDFQRFEDLIGRSGMHLMGGSLGDEFDSFAARHLDFREVPQSDRIIKMLNIDRADYGILGYVEGLQFIHTLGLTGRIVSLETPVLANPMHSLINKKAPCAHRLDEINTVLNQMQEDGTLDQILAFHLKRIGSQ